MANQITIKGTVVRTSETGGAGAYTGAPTIHVRPDDLGVLREIDGNFRAGVDEIRIIVDGELPEVGSQWSGSVSSRDNGRTLRGAPRAIEGGKKGGGGGDTGGDQS